MIDNAKQAAEYVRTQLEASEASRRYLINCEARDSLYYIGDHWRRIRVQTDGTIDTYSMGEGERKALRFTINRIRMLVQQAAAMTHPTKIDPQWIAPSLTPDAVLLRQTDLLEELASAVIYTSDFTQKARDANLKRRAFGNRVLGIRLASDTDDAKQIKAFECSPSRLVLDPAIESANLREHEVVAYHEVRTVNQIRSMFGSRVLENENLHEIGTIAGMELNANAVTNDRMFGWYRNHAKTKGARVYHVFVKGKGDRFEKMYQYIETAGSEGGSGLKMKQVNASRGGENPFQGDGLPMTLLSAHKRPIGPWSDGDIEILRRDQERLNIVSSFQGRILQNSAGLMVFADSNWFKHHKTASDIRNQFTNDPMNIVIGSSGGRHNYPAPVIRQVPSASPGLFEQSETIKAEMTELAHRAPGHSGQTKSHVPDATFQRALDEAERVHDSQIHDDLDRYSELLCVATATALRLVEFKGGAIRAAFEADGLSSDDMRVLKKIDPIKLVGRCRVRESSVRMRSQRARRQDLDFAVASGIMQPDQWIEAMSDDLDTPLTSHHRAIRDFARSVAERLISDSSYRFEPVPMDLGDAGMILRELQRAMMADKVQASRDLRDRVSEAIKLQAAAIQEYMSILAPPQPQQQELLPEEAPQPDQALPLDALMGPVGQLGVA